MAEANDYESEMTASREEIAAVLSSVEDGILAGSIRLGDGTDAVTVAIPEEIDLEIEFEAEDDELSLELELAWPSPEGEESGISPIAEIPEEEDDELSVPSSEGEESGASLIEEIPEEEDDELAVPVGAADASQALARFEVFRDQGEEWRWRLRHRNGNIIATSGEGYTRKHNAWKGLQSVMKNASEAEVTEDPPN
ncbi:amphi-Trp domain-containing protein [Halomicroarcula sp. GCM10025324]|uniref:amphi-Trp domain-containing protein n=1 Tax=Haloarcula TaxID=2237 RepID=UPI0023E792F5|nr:amphi-Trp domain-containing protein [Halomicroarcula sp. ZS-22-S1]